MVVELTRHLRSRFFACCEPCLSLAPLIEIVGRTWPAHPRRHPAGIDGIRKDSGPKPGKGKGKHRVMELGLGIADGTAPTPVLPSKTVEVCPGMAVHAGTQIDQPLRAFDEYGKQIGGKRVDCEYGGQSVGRHPPAAAVANGSVVDHGIENPQGIDLCRDLAHCGDGFEISEHDFFGLGQRSADVLGARFIARVQHDPVALPRQELTGHESEPR